MTARSTAARLAWLLVVCAATAARAQTLPSEPIALAQGRITIGGDVSASFGSEDPGFFDYTDYEHSALRMIRVDIAAQVKAGPHFALLAEMRTENGERPLPYAFYLRIRPWTARDFDVQIGRVPPTFGGFARRTYPSDNPLIGYPLAYQYLTTLRPDSLPASADELLRKRSLGWEVAYSLGDPTKVPGVPLVSAFRWDTGIQAHGTAGIVNATVAVTSGTLSNPRVTDDNDRGQIAGRVEARPVAGLILGGSGARGAFVSQPLARDLVGQASSNALTQAAWGADVEYSRGYYVLRWETIVSTWTVPQMAPPPPLMAIDGPLSAVSQSVEGKYKLRPGLYAAARYDHLGFSEVTGTLATLPWDAPVTRLEIGGGYSIQRNLLLKGSVQRNTRDGGVLLRHSVLGAAQLVFWF